MKNKIQNSKEWRGQVPVDIIKNTNQFIIVLPHHRVHCDDGGSKWLLFKGQNLDNS